ncbi:hypothetical protein [Primorskyibacter sp. 2E233]|uniref:hypothetical protein n=1 Tax=Primorskyibacter sp. 2E233 TaxID=3413431 RepID=UPI003BF19427
MDGIHFGQIVTAVLLGNALTGWFIHSAWVVTRIEKAGGKPSDAPWLALLGLIVPCLLGAGFAYLLTEG